MKKFRSLALAAVVAYLLVVVGCAAVQRRLLYFPSHEVVSSGRLEPWIESGESWGVRRVVERPSAVWLVTHGNAGQAAQREYIVELLPEDADVYVLEYPGYGARPGEPSRASFDAAASAAWRRLGELHPNLPRNVLGESIGTGPASQLALDPRPPDSIVLAVPFDRLVDVAAQTLPWLPVRWILCDDWDNVAALEHFPGRLVILAAERDTVIPTEHALALARSLPRAELRKLPGGHNDWSRHVAPHSLH
jgi:pimeloyl-ACP methyl ester carboxylesterase